MLCDAIVSATLNPYDCGVTRFNWGLAARLGIPMVALDELTRSPSQYPLISVHWSDENVKRIIPSLSRWERIGGHMFDLWLHDEGCLSVVLCRANRVWVGNMTLARGVARVRPDRRVVWCPSTIIPQARVPQNEANLSLLTFGMAHKLQRRAYERIRNLLGDRPYHLEVSTAVHDGCPWAEALVAVESGLGAIFGDRLRFWGALSDWGLAHRLSRATALVALFPEGVRANHTSVWAGLSAGIPVLTTLDIDSPASYRHGDTVWDVRALTVWPDSDALAAVGLAGQQIAQAYSWDRLLEVLRCDR